MTVRVAEGVSGIAASDWDRCAGTGNPFVRHRFLAILEESGCATAPNGWRPAPILVEREGLIAAAPAYVKAHSYGEYVFDWEWAEAYARAGGRYYPKVQVAVPFTPVTGPRLLGSDPVALAHGLTDLVSQNRLSSAHVTFCLEEEARVLESLGWHVRLGLQFHWENRGYGTFEDFLGALLARKRKTIRRERREVAETTLQVRALRGDEVGEAEWDAFYGFYVDTGSRKWGQPYLNRRFFRLLGQRMPEAVLLVLAEDGGRPVAGALNLLGDDTVYGRYWGAVKDAPFLHFELCYYQAIDFAIRHGYRRVEAGAQGSHKLQRGYLAHPTWSAHWFREPAFGRAVEAFLATERRLVQRQIDEAPSPYSSSSSSSSIST